MNAVAMLGAINKDELGFVPLLLVSCPNFVANKNGGKPNCLTSVELVMSSWADYAKQDKK